MINHERIGLYCRLNSWEHPCIGSRVYLQAWVFHQSGLNISQRSLCRFSVKRFNSLVSLRRGRDVCTGATSALGAASRGRRRPSAPADVNRDTEEMESSYYGRLLWQPQVSARASISRSVGEEEERGVETPPSWARRRGVEGDESRVRRRKLVPASPNW